MAQPVTLYSNKQNQTLTSSEAFRALAVDEVINSMERIEHNLIRAIGHASDDALVSILGATLSQLSVARNQIEGLSLSDRRSYLRVHEFTAAMIKRVNGRLDEVAVYDLSLGGCLIECDTALQDGEHFTLLLPGVDIHEAVAKASENGLAHVAFAHLSPQMLVALVKYIGRQFMRY